MTTPLLAMMVLSSVSAVDRLRLLDPLAADGDHPERGVVAPSEICPGLFPPRQKRACVCLDEETFSFFGLLLLRTHAGRGEEEARRGEEEEGKEGGPSCCLVFFPSLNLPCAEPRAGDNDDDDGFLRKGQQQRWRRRQQQQQRRRRRRQQQRKFRIPDGRRRRRLPCARQRV